MFSEIMRYILDLGPTVMLPIVIIIFSKLLGMKLGDCFKSGLHIGIGFVGIGLVIGLMLDSIGPAAKAMAEHFQINLHVIDIGWPGSSPMTWASQIALVAIPVAIAVNIVMLVTRMTRVVNVDIWNIWHMTFTGAMLHIATGSYWIGILGVVVHAAFVYKLGDWFAKDTRDFFGLEGIAIPHGSSAYLGPVAVLVDTIIDKIPGLNRIHFSADDIQKRVAAGYLERTALFEHRHQHGGAVVVKAVARPPRDRLRRGREQRLHLGQHRALAFHHAGDAGAGRVVRAAGKQHFRRIRHLDKALAAHFKDTDLIRRAKAVFCRAQDAVAHVRFTFEVQHAVDHVLQYLRACDRALLIDVSDDENSDALPFGELHQFHRTGAHLRHAARGRFQ